LLPSIETTVPRDLAGTELEIRAALARQGFGVLTEMDVAATLKAKLGVERPSLKILGTCNPTLVHRALELDPSVASCCPATSCSSPPTAAPASGSSIRTSSWTTRASRHWPKRHRSGCELPCGSFGRTALKRPTMQLVTGWLPAATCRSPRSSLIPTTRSFGLGALLAAARGGGTRGTGPVPHPWRGEPRHSRRHLAR
jgi:hypothetical protein